VNTGKGELICIAWAEAEHEPSDVHPFAVWPKPRASVTESTLSLAPALL
jgi:hypothetical protein